MAARDASGARDVPAPPLLNEFVTAVFVDFDGTITDIDTIDALARAFAGDAFSDQIDDELEAGRITIREAFTRQAAAMRLSRAETLAWVERNVRLDPTFKPFVDAVRASGASICVVSSGIASVIHDVLARSNIKIDVLANDVAFSAAGWRIDFIDESPNAHDKAARVRAARAAGARTVYIGDGISDFAAAVAADYRFAKRGLALQAYCRKQSVECFPFISFDEINGHLVELGVL